MAETKDAHIVQIPVDEEHQQKLFSAAIQHHPLAEISQSPGHFLLLKLWQREDLFSRRMSRKESRKDGIGREIFQLCCFFFVFYGLFFTILFTSTSSDIYFFRGPSLQKMMDSFGFVSVHLSCDCFSCSNEALQVLESGAAVAEGSGRGPGPDMVHSRVEDERGQF